MHQALTHFVLLLVAAAFCWVGWLIAHNPERTFKALTFAVEPGPRLLVDLVRFCGWAFAVLFGLGTMIAVGEIASDLLRAH